VTDFQDGHYSIYKDQVVASNGLLHQQMCEVLRRARR